VRKKNDNRNPPILLYGQTSCSGWRVCLSNESLLVLGLICFAVGCRSMNPARQFQPCVGVGTQVVVLSLFGVKDGCLEPELISIVAGLMRSFALVGDVQVHDILREPRIIRIVALVGWRIRSSMPPPHPISLGFVDERALLLDPQNLSRTFKRQSLERGQESSLGWHNPNSLQRSLGWILVDVDVRVVMAVVLIQRPEPSRGLTQVLNTIQ